MLEVLCVHCCTVSFVHIFYRTMLLLSLCVSPFVRHKLVLYRNNWTNRTGIWLGGFLTPKEIWVSSKISVLPSGTLSQTLHLENFATASRLLCQQLVIIVDGRARACWRHLYDSRRVVAVYYKSINCSPLTPFDLLWICRTVCFYSWQNFDWLSASRRLSAVAEFLMLLKQQFRNHLFLLSIVTHCFASSIIHVLNIHHIPTKNFLIFGHNLRERRLLFPNSLTIRLLRILCILGKTPTSHSLRCYTTLWKLRQIWGNALMPWSGLNKAATVHASSAYCFCLFSKV